MQGRDIGDKPYAVGEAADDGMVTPVRDAATNEPATDRPQSTLFHVANAVFDCDDRLWLLNAGLQGGSVSPVTGAAKLLRIDIDPGKVLRIVPLDPGVEPPSSMNDLQVDLVDGRERAFVTNQGQDEEGVVLAVKSCRRTLVRRLAKHASTKSQEDVVKFVERRPVMRTSGPGRARHVKSGANGIALGADVRRLYKCR